MSSESETETAGNVVAIHGLRTTAKAVAARYGDEGAIIISVGKEGVRVGTDGLSHQQVQDALCVAINYNFTFSETGSG